MGQNAPWGNLPRAFSSQTRKKSAIKLTNRSYQRGTPLAFLVTVFSIRQETISLGSCSAVCCLSFPLNRESQHETHIISMDGSRFNAVSSRSWGQHPLWIIASHCWNDDQMDGYNGQTKRSRRSRSFTQLREVTFGGLSRSLGSSDAIGCHYSVDVVETCGDGPTRPDPGGT